MLGIARCGSQFADFVEPRLTSGAYGFFDAARLLLDRGADLTIRARVPGHYERSGELLDVSGAEYNAIFPLR